MLTSRASGKKQLQMDEPQRRLESPFQTDEEAAWEPLEGDLWIPHRIRGSWRGGVLG
jgi:hypothetical protein